MAAVDLIAFIQQRVAVFDENLDTTTGSPFYLQVIQPIINRLGTDPFALDFITFAQQRINEVYPDLATREGDAITDLLIKVCQLLMDPILREISRVQSSQSFRDSATLTTDEADALGANLFAQRNTGAFARGRARLFFTQPQNTSVTPANFLTTKGGLHFFPSATQSISSSEMLFNLDSTGLYYFDVDIIAEKAGDEYNVAPSSIITIANLTSVPVRVTNLRSFAEGSPAEDAVTFIDRAEQELTERSMVTLRGVLARLTNVFPDISSTGVIGFNDPEMERDVVEGGGLGLLRASGIAAIPTADGENAPLTRRLDLTTDLAALSTTLSAIVGPTNVMPKGWVFTYVDPTTVPYVFDVDVVGVVSDQLIDLATQVLPPNVVGTVYSWTLRKRELTLSHIPGGILYPNGPSGTVTVPEGVVHVGGATDVLVRGTGLDSSTLVINAVTDDSPALHGSQLTIVDGVGHVSLGDYVLGVNYMPASSTFNLLQQSAPKGFSLQILDGAAAGTYRSVAVLQSSSSSPILLLNPTPVMVGGDYRWKLIDEIDVNLVEPKETRISGNDLISVQGTDLLETVSSLDFSTVGVSIGDTVRLTNGLDAGDFTVVALLSPFFDQVQVNRPLTASATNITYTIFRPNAEGGVTRPLIRISSIDLLDTSGQPVGSKVPYAKAVDARSNAFANFAHGVKSDVHDARLGLVGIPLTGPHANVNGLSLVISSVLGGTHTVLFSGVNPISLTDIVDQINTALGLRGAYILDGNRLGITPLGGTTTIPVGGARPLLFGSPDELRSSRDIRSDLVTGTGGWAALSPTIDQRVDVAQVLDGFQIGFYSLPQPQTLFSTGSTALWTEHDFNPEADRHFQVGSRSVGSARVFFLEPTSVEFTAVSRFKTLTPSGIPVSYLPDLTVSSQRVPALPAGTKPEDGATTASGNLLTSSSSDFVQTGILPGDQLVIDYTLLTGTAILTDPVASLATSPLKYITLSIGGGPDKNVYFIHDSVAIPATSVTRKGVADQINQIVGKSICSIISVGGNFYLQFDFTDSIVIRRTGTANAILGFSTIVDQNNDSAHKGKYIIDSVLGPTQLLITTTFPAAFPPLTEQFSIFRPGAQRFGTTQMSTQKAEASLYYVDVELVSEGTGDLWNIPDALQFTVSGYDSDGYWLSTSDPDLTFSTVEPLQLHLSKSVREVGVDDDPKNATQLEGQNIQVTYDSSSLVVAVENFVSSETERVICESPLARHLIPFFVRMDLTYSGGAKVSDLTTTLTNYIQGLLHDEFLEVSAVEKLFTDAGATFIVNPLTLIALVYNFDRTVTVDRSQNRVSVGRLAAFIPDILNITRQTG